MMKAKGVTMRWRLLPLVLLALALSVGTGIGSTSAASSYNSHHWSDLQ